MKKGNFPIPGEGVPAYLVKYGIKASEWHYAVKHGLGVLMRPGIDLRPRIIILGQRHSMGYPGGGGEFCIMQVRARPGDPPKFVPLTPSAISAELLDVDIEEFRKSGKELSPDERKKRRISLPEIRRMIESLEGEDGVFTRVTMTKFLSQDQAIRKLGWTDLQRLCGLFEKRTFEDGKVKWVQVSEGLSLAEARAQNLVTPIRELSKKDRQRLNGKSFLYCHVHPRPATIAALTRRTVDDYTGASAKTNGLHVELGTPVQLMLRLLRAEGLSDPKLAAALAARPDGQAHIQKAQQVKELIREVESDMKQWAHDLLEVYKAQGALPEIPPAAVQVPMFPPTLVPKAGDTSDARATGTAKAPNSLDVKTASVLASDYPPLDLAPAQHGRQAGINSAPERDRASRSAPPPPRSPSHLAAAAEFNDTLCIRFHAVHASLPTKKQTDTTFKALGTQAPQFLAWLSASEMQRRKPKHGGILPCLVEEFLKIQAMPAVKAEESYVERQYREEMERKKRKASNG